MPSNGSWVGIKPAQSDRRLGEELVHEHDDVFLAWGVARDLALDLLARGT